LAASDTVGAETGVTVTATERSTVPPAPVHESLKVTSPVSAPLDSLPLVSFVPLQPPLAVQESAFVLRQVRVVLSPAITEVGLALSVRVGAGSLPPPPPPPPPPPHAPSANSPTTASKFRRKLRRRIESSPFSQADAPAPSCYANAITRVAAQNMKRLAIRPRI